MKVIDIYTLFRFVFKEFPNNQLLLLKLLGLVDKNLLNIDQSVGFYLNKINSRFDLTPIRWECIKHRAVAPLQNPLAIDLSNATDEFMEKLLEKIISNNTELFDINEENNGTQITVEQELPGIKCQQFRTFDELCLLRSKIQNSVICACLIEDHITIFFFVSFMDFF